MAESSGASSFFSDDDHAGRTAHIQAGEAAFEERAVRAVLKTFGIDPKGWDVKEKMGQARYRLAVFDEVYPGFPVRLGASRVVGLRMGAKRRGVNVLGFHEVTPAVLFNPDEFRKLRVYKDWTDLKGDQTLDRRSVGLVFGAGTGLFVLHDWVPAPHPPAGIRLVWTPAGGDAPVTVEPFTQLLAFVEWRGWRP